MLTKYPAPNQSYRAPGPKYSTSKQMPGQHGNVKIINTPTAPSKQSILHVMCLLHTTQMGQKLMKKKAHQMYQLNLKIAPTKQITVQTTQSTLKHIHTTTAVKVHTKVHASEQRWALADANLAILGQLSTTKIANIT